MSSELEMRRMCGCKGDIMTRFLALLCWNIARREDYKLLDIEVLSNTELDSFASNDEKYCDTRPSFPWIGVLVVVGIFCDYTFVFTIDCFV